jgi:hypothetical protein
VSKTSWFVVALLTGTTVWAGHHFLGVPQFGQGKTADCAEGFENGFRDSVPPEYKPFLDDASLTAAIRDVCADLVNRPGVESLTEENGAAFVAKVFREKPELYRSLCESVVDADIAASKQHLAYVSEEEVATYEQQMCTLSVSYLRDDARVDLAALLRDHADVWSPVCASSMETELVRNGQIRTAFSKRELNTTLRRACAEGVRTGALDVSGPRGFLDLRVDQRRFRAIFLGAARDVLGQA